MSPHSDDCGGCLCWHENIFYLYKLTELWYKCRRLESVLEKWANEAILTTTNDDDAQQEVLLRSGVRTPDASAALASPLCHCPCSFLLFLLVSLLFFSWCSLHPLLAAMTQLEGEWQVQCWATFYKALYTPNTRPPRTLTSSCCQMCSTPSSSLR